MSESTVIAHASALVTRALDPPIGDGWVLVEDGQVVATGAGIPPNASLVVDASGCLVLPGLICAHHHLSQGASRGIRTHPDLIEWLAVHYERWALMRPADAAAGARLSAAQLLLSGCTTVATFEYLHPEGEDFATPVIEAAAGLGSRLLYVRGTAPRLEADLEQRLSTRGVDVARLIEPPDQGLRRITDFVSKRGGERLRFGCGPTTPVLDDGGEFQHALNDIADAAAVPQHLHYHPIGGVGPEATAADLARRLGLLKMGNWFAHGSRLTPADVAELGAAGVGVVHCPSASLRLGYEIPSLSSWGTANDRIAVAVDGAASNDRGAMLGEIQLAWYLQGQPHLVAPSRLSPEKILHMATEGAALTIGWEGLGTLTPGSAADLAIFDLTDVDTAGAAVDENPLFALFTTHRGADVRHVFVAGEPVVADGRLTRGDRAQIAGAAQEARKRVSQRMGIAA